MDPERPRPPAIACCDSSRNNSEPSPSVIATEPTPTTMSHVARWRDFEAMFSIGRGQFGVVFLMKHPDGRKVVDKRLGLTGMSEKERADTRQEIELLRTLEHEHIVTLFDDFVDRNGPEEVLHIIMEYCGGGSLADQVEQQQQLKRHFDPCRLRRWLVQLASALAHVHSHRVLHRDLKTANIFLTEDDGPRGGLDVRLGDFGISRLLSSQTSLAASCVGTPYYLSPELVAGQGYDDRADVWSLGVVAYELLALRRPFTGESIGQLAMRITTAKAKPLPGSTPPDLQEVVGLLLQKEAQLRPTAATLLAHPLVKGWAEQQAATNAAADADAANAAGNAEAPPPASPAGVAVDEGGAAGAGADAGAGTGLRRVYAWATSPEGGGGTAEQPLWQLVDSLRGEEVVQLGGSSTTLLAVTAAGQVFTWGTPQAQASGLELPFARARRAAPLLPLGAKGVTAAAAADETLLALASGMSATGAITGDIWQWAAGEPAPLLVAISGAISGAVSGGLRVGSVACGARHCVACTHGGLAFSWGSGEEGQLGLADFDDREEPAPLPLPAGFEAIDAACGAEHTLLLGSDGGAVSCGADEHGQLGHAQPDDAGRCCELRPVALPAGVRGVVQASCGAHHAVVLTDDARVVSWGSAEGGLLGRKRGERAGGGGGSTAMLPAVVPLLTEHRPVSLSASKYHTVAVTAAGALYLWGRVADKTYAAPTPVRGEQLGGARFVRACATDWYTLVVAVAPEHSDEGDGGAAEE